MATTVNMPQLGETVTEGTILSWPKKVGDTIHEDEVLVEVSTDKVDTEIPSPVAGTILAILVPEGETVKVGTPMVVVGEAGEQVAAEPQAAPEPVPEAAPEPEPAPAAESAPEPPAAPVSAPPTGAPVPPTAVEEQRFLSPVVRKLARENDLDLSQIQGTGRGGRITRNDVLAYLERRPAPATAPEPVTPPAPAHEPVAAPAGPAATPAEVPTLPGDEVRDLSRLRARIGENLTRAKQTAAHVWTSVEVDYEAVERVRQRHRAAFKEQEGFSLTYLPFIARATVDALKAFPVVNSSFYLEQKKAVFHNAINLGIAVNVEGKGLIVTSLKDADGLRLVGLARAIRDLADKARGGGLHPDDVAGFTFSITNPGPYGSFMSAPILPLPNVGILSTESIVKRPTVITSAEGQDMIAIHPIGYLGFTWDHRAFDGVIAVQFLNRIKENLQSWDWQQELS
ncbi:MAG: dihydrolipoyllysine-residue succinyltransferase [Gammaproteobacteria bacterium]|nr:dihydrolipoyllysine-residue succinyltransferase [Gammaproteobacteria bacterium]